MPKKKLTKNQKKVVELKEHLVTQGWEEDAYGHMKIRIGKRKNRQMRIKFQKTSIRVEVKPDLDREGNKWTHGWIKRWGSYLKDVYITEDGYLKSHKLIK